MKDYFNKKYQKAKLHFENFKTKASTRTWNLAKRMDLGHKKGEKKK
ncbi:MAG: hypothetical protein AAB877_03335 [Patescibacteria group bacterium]